MALPGRGLGGMSHPLVSKDNFEISLNVVRNVEGGQRPWSRVL